MILDLALDAFRGPVGRAPSLQLALWLTWDGPAGPWRSTVLERRDDGLLDAREGAVPREILDVLHDRLRAAGLGTRPVRAAEVVDTSDTAGHVRLRALFSDAPRAWTEVVVPMLSSGFEGADAGALREALRRLLDAAGVRSANARGAALGERG